jgi:FlaA1/EpsC-like NDP-sugar epimerase
MDSHDDLPSPFAIREGKVSVVEAFYRRFHRAVRLGADLGALSIALWVAWLLRFEGELTFQTFKQAMFVWPWIVGLQYACLTLFEVPRFAWSHVGLREARKIGKALGLALVLLCLVRFFSGVFAPAIPYLAYTVVPYGVLVIDALLAVSLILGLRVARRVQIEDRRARAQEERKLRPVLLIGAGYAGTLLARELASRQDLGRTPVGFLDDDPFKQGHLVEGLPILGTLETLAEVAAQHDELEEVLITAPSMSGERVRVVRRQADALGLAVKTIPGLYEIVSGEAQVSQIRDVAIEDLLRRNPVKLDVTSVEALVRDRVVLITGAGGSIGSELCRQVARFGARRLVLVERAENPLFEIHGELRRTATSELAPYVVDVRTERLGWVLEQERPHVVLHAAAHKHVPLMEVTPGEAVLNNLWGTRNAAELSQKAGVEVFVMVSTDKAVNPTSVMGASKRAAELYLETQTESATRFVTVRFGNVLGSSGSVVPVFRSQIARGGPVTVTHEDMTRFFMTIPEASQLILQAAALGTEGDTYVLDMGKPVKIVDLARDLIELSGFTVDEIGIVFAGVRPGEKLYEELSSDAEKTVRLKEHKKIFVVREGEELPDDLSARLEALIAAARSGDDEIVRGALRTLTGYLRPERDQASLPVRNLGTSTR